MIVPEVRLTSDQWKFLANWCVGMSQVAVASIVIPFFLDKQAINLALLGLVIASGLTIIGLFASKKVAL